jgi:hypothetical protein
MIIVKLKGGLGNQLFQYAVGRHLAEIHKTVLKIDLSLFETYKEHIYSLSPFNIQENVALKKEVAVLIIQKQKYLERVIKRILSKSQKLNLAPNYIKEKDFQFDAHILDMPDDIYLDGYWQSEKYFSDIASIIHKEFSVKSPQIGKDKDLAEQIGLCNSISLHIRRGSYLQPPYNSFHGLCSLDYYYHGVDYLANKVQNPHFFVFSDDPDWVSKNLMLNYPMTFVNHNSAERDYEDFRLMTQCKHHLIANSTFSWWAAWLCSNPDKIVVAPKKWFKDPNIKTNDLIPPSWYRI